VIICCWQRSVAHASSVLAIGEARLAKVQVLLEEIFNRNPGECKPGWYIDLY